MIWPGGGRDKDDSGSPRVAVRAQAARPHLLHMKLIHQANVRRFTLELAKNMGRSRFTRVSKTFLDRINSQLRVEIAHEVHRHPSKGKTLK